MHWKLPETCGYRFGWMMRYAIPSIKAGFCFLVVALALPLLFILEPARACSGHTPVVHETGSPTKSASFGHTHVAAHSHAGTIEGLDLGQRACGAAQESVGSASHSTAAVACVGGCCDACPAANAIVPRPDSGIWTAPAHLTVASARNGRGLEWKPGDRPPRG